MAPFEPDPTKFGSLKDQVFVIMGGSSGMGRATVSLLHSLGAYVIFGDVQAAAGESLCAELASDRILFLQTDASNYKANLALFKLALSKFGRVDHAMSIAGVTERGLLLDPNLNLESVEEEPNMMTLDVNLKGVLYFTRIASVYLCQNTPEKQDKSIVLLSSIAGITEAPGIPIYSAAKHGVIGLMRAARIMLYESRGIRVNAVSPWFTATPMVRGIDEMWYRNKMPVNQPEDLGKIIVGLAADKGANGLGVFVGGGVGWDVEEGIDATRPQWFEKERNEIWMKGQTLLATGAAWNRGEK